MTESDIIAGPYVDDLLAQPEAVRATVGLLRVSEWDKELAALLEGSKFSRVVLTGMGSSFHALHPLVLRLEAGGWTAIAIETSELIHYHRSLLGPETLLIVVSQSGRSAEIVRLVNLAKRRSTMIGLTNTADSPLARNSEVTLLMRAGKEYSVSSRTYVASLAALAWLAEVMTGRNPNRTAGELARAEIAMAGYLRSWRRHVSSLRRVFDGVEHLFITGRGPSLAAVRTGALIIKEAARFPAEAMSTAAFRHGPLEITASNVMVAVLHGRSRTAALNEALVRDVKRAGGLARLVGETGSGAFRLPKVTDTVAPLFEILPLQMMSLALAANSGHEAGRFRHASKITVVE
jgi:glucosamine--fructose-6-phosphate aminotransferase (isomerizing)